MNIKLAIPIFYKDAIYTDVEIVKPSGAVLADTKKSADGGDPFDTTRTLLNGCIKSIIKNDETVISDPIAIKTLIGKMPYKSSEQVSLEIVMLVNTDDDGIEAIYYCPRCKHPSVAELKNNDGMTIDTRDFISQLETGYYDGTDGIITHEMIEPVILKNAANGEVIYEIKSFSMRFPTIEDGINAFQRYGKNDEVRLQFAMFVQALVKINGAEMKPNFKNNFGMTFFEGIKDVKNDIGGITKEINSYGIIPNIKKTCTQCGKEWIAQVNTSNFFDSALRPM